MKKICRSGGITMGIGQNSVNNGPKHFGMRKNLVSTLSALILVLTLLATQFGCTGKGGSLQKVMNIGIILGSGGLGDRSFNDSAYSGLLDAQKKYDIRFETISFGDNTSN